MTDCPHEIVHKETGRTVGEYKNYAEAYAAYEKLGTGNDGMSDHAIGVIMVYDKITRTYVPKPGVKVKDYPQDLDQLSNKFFMEAFPDAESLSELYRQVYKYSQCGAYMCATIEYLEVTGTCFDDYHEQIVQKTFGGDELQQLGTWQAMDERGQLAVSFTVGSIVEGVDYGTEDIEIEAQQLDETPSEYRTRFDAALKEVEQEAESIWQDTHGCESCQAYWTDQGVDLDDSGGLVPVYKYCPDCQGNGTSI